MMTTDELSPPRIEAGLKVTGAAQYSAEIAVDGVLHAALAPASLPSGQIRSIDDSVTRALPGVVAVFTHGNAPRLREAAVPFLKLLQEPIVYFAGQPVAMVVAETPRLARLAADAMAVTYAELAATTGITHALDRAFAPK